MLSRTSSRALCAMILSLGLAACGDDDNNNMNPDAAINPDAPIDAPPDGLQVTWVQDGNFMGPESARWDSANQFWYVSNLGEAFGAEDQPGWITRLNADGTVADEKWVADLGTPVGMAILGGSLYVADSGSILVIDIATAEVTDTIAVPGAAFLNDVAAGNGKIYVSDTFGNKIYELTPGEEPVVLIDSAELDFPNGLYVRGNELVIAALGDLDDDNNLGSLMTLSLETSEITALGTLEGRFDGVEADGQDLLVTDFSGKLYRIKPTGDYDLIVDLVADHGFMSTADLGWDSARRMVVMPDLSGHQVGTFTIP
jgi:YVTN family beta-propeller protein